MVAGRSDIVDPMEKSQGALPQASPKAAQPHRQDERPGRDPVQRMQMKQRGILF